MSETLEGIAARFIGDDGRRRLIGALERQALIVGNHELATEIATVCTIMAVKPDGSIIEQGSHGTDVFFIIAGDFRIVVNGRVVAVRGPGSHVGEMAAIEPSQVRSATVTANNEAVVASLTESQFATIANKFSILYQRIAQELSRRLLSRNAFINQYRDKIRVFIISSVESLGVSREIVNAFEHDPFDVQVWSQGVFRASNYTIEALEREIDNSDFAVAIAHADDATTTRGQTWPTPRDNVIFELGLFMGRLGRRRAILMEPREEKVKLPSDMAGITTIPYKFVSGPYSSAAMASACNHLREHINDLGPNNG
ncbi:cyclic nucleotide-binding domain-containing protein [Labrys sp. KNU-23]|uniref:TIR domain-containing protein n=1 Tax=Labrys sp. KNU-23 TaxID=2789216 RepID=UPI0011EEBD65|nr:TIR domain-containing protein [Labrys sp. KNU-23]QEN87712.1 cyclic nucleotide-binding domain-containing protein [Labrys sp. KNU-23]